MKISRISALAIAATMGLCLDAQTFAPEANLSFDTRFDYQYDWVNGHTVDENSGFKGKYLNIHVNGQINDKFSFSLRHRLNKTINSSSFFDATDWVYLTYRPNARWAFSGGKQVVAIGGYEYDKAPINVYTASEFWNHIPCYEFGVSAAYSLPTPTANTFMAQICASPFHATPGNSDNSYAYNLMWTHSGANFGTLWSVNLIEYTKGKFINYISLGNRFSYDGWELELDLMNRAAAHQTFLFKDCSVIGKLSYDFNTQWRVFGKVTYDVNHSGTDADITVWDGSELWSYTAGVEYYPLINARHKIRLHAFYTYDHGRNTNNSSAELCNKNSMAAVGVTWAFDVLRLK